MSGSAVVNACLGASTGRGRDISRPIPRIDLYKHFNAVFRSVVQIPALSMNDIRQYIPLRGCAAISLQLDQNVNYGSLLIDRPPEIPLHSVDLKKTSSKCHLDPVGLVSLSQFLGKVRAELAAPFADSRSVEELTADIQKPTHCGDRRVRGLRPWAEDKKLHTAINRGEFLINGLRNRNLQKVALQRRDQVRSADAVQQRSVGSSD